MSPEETLAKELGELVKKKGQAYGNSIPTVTKILHLLYPDGIRPRDYMHASCLVRLLDKVKRISTNNDPFGESPWWDIAGYGLRVSLILKEEANAGLDNNGSSISSISDIHGDDTPVASGV